jgi:hypothetical protein
VVAKSLVVCAVILASSVAAADPRCLTKQTPAQRDETPQAAPPDTKRFLALYVSVGRELRDLHTRDPDAATDLMTRYRIVNVMEAARSGSKRRIAAQRLHDLHRLIQLHR